jgi:dipicolinate synthase subunit A
VAEERLSVIWEGCPVLITGGGRIAQCLAQLLKALGADVVLLVRRQEQRALLSALGFETETPDFPEYILSRFRVIFNTVPAPILSARALGHCRPECLKIELASVNGLEGDDIIIARGLPGIWAPETSGRLIARTVLRLCAKKEAAL